MTAPIIRVAMYITKTTRADLTTESSTLFPSIFTE